MKLLGLVFIFLVVEAIREPGPITSEEEVDEVAQTQQRAVWVACLDLASRFVERDSDLISKVSSQKSVQIDSVIKKYSAEFLVNCEKIVDYQLAEKYLAGEDSQDVIDLKSKHLSEVLTSNPSNFALTYEENQLISKITKEANTIEDGFDQEPPIVPEVFNLKDNKVFYAAVAGIAVLLIFLVWLLSGNDSSQDKKSSERAKSPPKKKRE